MKNHSNIQLIVLTALLTVTLLQACKSRPANDSSGIARAAIPVETPAAGETIIGDSLPPPNQTPSASKNSSVIGWPAGKSPKAPPGFQVTRFAENLNGPRWIYQASNGDVFVSEAQTHGSSGDDVLLLRDTKHTGTPDLKTVFLSGLNQPFGMLVLGNYFYVANTDGLWRYPYQTGQTKMTQAGTRILTLPAGGYNNHWTRNVIASKDGTKLYVTVGSGSNVGENGMSNEAGRANILQLNPDGTGVTIYASGLRNPNGLDWAPVTGALWTAVNERDGLGDNLVPDYITHVQSGGFYGWPYSYYGQHVDKRIPEDTTLVKKAIVPSVQTGSHTATLSLAFYTKSAFPAAYQGGAFIGQHGSWNRSVFAGYQVAYVPFTNGRPTAKPQTFLKGFIADSAASQVYGRPVGVAAINDGSLLVADDGGNIIWRVSATN